MTLPDIHDIPLAAIEVGSDRTRDLEPAWAEALAALIGAQGLMQPIIVRPVDGAFRRYRLVAGLHRTEAFRRLGRETIPAFLSAAASDDEALLEEVMENLGRYELIALDRCRHLHELKRIHERKYPQAKRGGDRKSIKNPSRVFDPDAPEVFGFAKATADKIGLSQTRINEAVKIWTELLPAVRARLIGSDLARKMTELKALSELTPSQQVKVIDLIQDADQPAIRNVADALAFLDRGSAVSPIEKQFKAVNTAFGKLSDAAVDMVMSNHADRAIAALKRLGRI